MKQIFVHCGLHKTGTTALQFALMANAHVLRQHNILYPTTGRLNSLGGGHHNIAWEVSRDRRFNAEGGDIAKLVEEINAFPGNVVISSEDFESFLHDRKAVDGFAHRLKECAAEINFIVYLRNQLSYCQSIFMEHLNRDVGEEYPLYLEDITRLGCRRVKDGVFQFDYVTMLQSLSSGNVSLMVRNFHHLKKQSSIVDFFDIIGIDDQAIQSRIDHRTNKRQPLNESMKCFYSNRVGRPLDQRDLISLRTIANHLAKQKLVNSPSTKTMFQRVFADGNASICRQFGLPLEGLDMSSAVTDGGVTYEGIFSFEFQNAVMRMRHLLGVGKRNEADKIAAAFVAAATI